MCNTRDMTNRTTRSQNTPAAPGKIADRLYWAAITDGRIECGSHAGYSTTLHVSKRDLVELADLGLDHCEDCGKRDERTTKAVAR